MDKTDLEIITLLQSDGRRPFTEIADSIGISEGTVRNRVSRLIEDKIIQIVGIADPIKLGYHAPALIGVSVQPPLIDRAAEDISNYDEVSYLIMVSGEFDLFVEVRCKDRNHLVEFLNHKLSMVEGVTRTQSFMILHTYKLAYDTPHKSFNTPEE
jgi:Lrp/AsnC family transcriptional regulator for asnA, asnC and gidA